MSPSQSQSEVQDDQDESAPEPQQPRTRAPSHYQAVPFSAGTMPNAFDWQQRQIGSAQSGAMGHFTSPYNTLEAPGFEQHLNMTCPPITPPYIVQPAYPSPVMQHPAYQAQAVFGMPAGTHAAQASHSPLHYQSGVDPLLQQQVNHHNVFSPNQSIPGMTATGFQPNNNSHNFMDHNHFIVPPMGPSMPNAMYPEVPQPNDAALPPANTNSWTTPQDDLVRRLKHEKKKVVQIQEELRREFGVVRSGNAISKRWKQIMKKDSEEVKFTFHFVSPFHSLLPSLPIIVHNIQIPHHRISPSPPLLPNFRN